MIDQILESRTTSIMISAFPTNPFTGKNKGLVAVLALVVLVMAALGFWVLDRAMQNSALSKAQTLAENDAAILAEGLQSELEKFSLVPLVLAEDPEVQALLAGRNASAAVLNRRLEQLVIQTGAAAIYLTNTDGTALAASNWRFHQFCRFELCVSALFHQGDATGACNAIRAGYCEPAAGTIYCPARH